MPVAEDSKDPRAEDLVEWVTQEVRDLLEAGPVGLYEFIWVLRGAGVDATQDQLFSYAVAALARLEEDEAIQRVRLVWPEAEGVTVPIEDLSSDDWDDPVDDRPYLAVSLKNASA